jgi:glycerol-1-phosphate dehydrogenase [NAD(P)+]
MENKNIIFSNQAWSELGRYLHNADFRTVAVVKDFNLTELFWDELKEYIPRKIKIIEVDGVNLKKIGANHCFSVECVIGFGGGTNIDQAKMIALESKCSLVIVPTKPTAAIASRVASIETLEGRATIETPEARAVFIKKGILIPEELLVSECGDMLSSWSAIPDAVLAHIRGKENAKMELLMGAYKRGERIFEIENVCEEESIELLYSLSLEIGIIGDKYGSTRPSSGTEHKISHAIDEVLKNKKRKLHGEQVSFGVLCSLYLQEEHDLLHKHLKQFGFSKIKPSDFKVYLGKIGLPRSFEELGVRGPEVISTLARARIVRPEPRYTIIDELTNDRVIEILKDNVYF